MGFNPKIIYVEAGAAESASSYYVFVDDGQSDDEIRDALSKWATPTSVRAIRRLKVDMSGFQ